MNKRNLSFAIFFALIAFRAFGDVTTKEFTLGYQYDSLRGQCAANYGAIEDMTFPIESDVEVYSSDRTYGGALWRKNWSNKLVRDGNSYKKIFSFNDEYFESRSMGCRGAFNVVIVIKS